MSATDQPDQAAIVKELYSRRESLPPEKRAVVDELYKRFNPEQSFSEKTRNFLMTGKTSGPGHYSPDEKGTFEFPAWLNYTAGAVGIAELAPALIKGGPEAFQIVKGLISKFGSGLTKAPKGTQMDLAFKLFQEVHGSAPKSPSQQVQAIKEMREALKATAAKAESAPAKAPNPSGYGPTTGGAVNSPVTPAAQPAAPPPTPYAKGPSNGGAVNSPVTPAEAPKPIPAKYGPSTGGAVNAPVTPPPPSPRPTPAAYGPSTGTVSPQVAKVAPSPVNTLTAPPAIESGTVAAAGEKPIKYESVARTDKGAVLRRGNLKAGIAKDHPGLTKQKFLDMTAKQKNELIRKYNPQSINRPYIEDSKVFKEFADHVWPE